MEERSTSHIAEKIITSLDSVVTLNKHTQNGAEWSIGRINDFGTGKDGIAQGLKMKHGRRYIVDRTRQPKIVFILEKLLIQEKEKDTA